MPTQSYTYEGTPYSLYSRSPFTDEQAADALENHYNTGKQSFDPKDEKSIMVQPGNISSPGYISSHLRTLYDQFAAPISHGISAITDNPTVQSITGPGFTAPTGVVNRTDQGTSIDFNQSNPDNSSGIKALGDYLKNTINDPVATGLLFAGGPMGMAGRGIMGKIAPVVLSG